MSKYSRGVVIFVLGSIVALSAAAPYGRIERIVAAPRAAALIQTDATPAKNARVQTIPFESKLVGKTLPYNILLPVDYDKPAAKTKFYPVIYLLHGVAGHYTNWVEKTRLVDYATAYDFIIVTPEGNDGWYTDSATVPSEKYESYIVQELIPDVQKRFRASSEREGRAVAGLSMGGYGAIKFGLKHPEKFAFAASLSGAFSAASWTEQEIKEPGVIRDSVLQTFGPATSETRVANDVLKLVREAKPESLPYFYLDCGTEDFLFSDNRQFVTLLVEKKIQHEYRQLPGTHSWQYWDSQVQEVLRVAAKKLRSPAAAMKAAIP
ncbi:MAG TPA: alpha/beta hydrolase family protein [Pyrinomonadaceae bacterium]|nr:alpha/beta hydrolase family protein [Pyrinomonadaceae bacterium]